MQPGLSDARLEVVTDGSAVMRISGKLLDGGQVVNLPLRKTFGVSVEGDRETVAVWIYALK